MELYCYSETSEQVEKSEAIELGPNRGGLFVSGPNAYRVELHGTITEAIESLLFLRWDKTHNGAIDKYVEAETKKAQDHMSNAMYAKSLKRDKS